MATFITVDQAATHLRISGSEYADDLQIKIPQAEALVLDYMKIDADALTELAWTITTTGDRKFDIARAAVLEVLTNIYFDRGDRDRPSEGPLTDRVKNFLSMQRDPTIA